METKEITDAILINASKEKVWDVLTKDEFTRIWYAEFSPGSHADTTWEVGSKAVFTDNSGSGLIADVVENKPGEILALRYVGIVNKGTEDYESEGAQTVKGGREAYVLSEENGETRLQASCDMSDDMYEMMSEAWGRAIHKIKHLAEN